MLVINICYNYFFLPTDIFVGNISIGIGQLIATDISIDKYLLQLLFFSNRYLSVTKFLL